MLLNCLLVLVAIRTAAAISAVGFQPLLSSSCANALANYSVSTSTSCGTKMSDVLLSESNFGNCTSGTKDTECFNPQSVYNAALEAKYTVPSYKLQTDEQCKLCNKTLGMGDSCKYLLDALSDVVYGRTVDYSVFGISDASMINALNQKANLAYEKCSNDQDRASVVTFQFQAQVICGSMQTFDKEVSKYGNIDGILDLRSLTQCGKCAVTPCLLGQYCDGINPAIMCPEGYYCPSTTEKIKCPSGYYCPEASTEPQKCRTVGDGSCEESGSERDVAYIPLIFSLVTMTIIFVASWFDLSHRFNNIPTERKDSLMKGNMEFSMQSPSISIAYNNITMITNGNRRLDNISGTIRAARFTAIIGGSGAGKTSLMNVILGRERANEGVISYFEQRSKKKLSMNEEDKISPKILDRIVAFVPQNDVCLREMTVEELVTHSASWRCPAICSNQEVLNRVDEVLSQLQLQHIRYQTVGGASSTGKSSLGVERYLRKFFGSSAEGSVARSKGSTRGISPGDRKKVNIALELVSVPNILFLDEPTSGIDASSALNVVQIVSNLARNVGLTCVAVIHQPRTEIFNYIDDIIVLVRGGQLAYQGPACFVMQYFAERGCELQSSPSANKTDFLIDITSKPPPRSAEDRLEEEYTVGTWSTLWTKYGQEFIEKKQKQFPEQFELNSHVTTTDEEHVVRQEATESSSKKILLPLDIARRGFFWQFYLFAERGVRQHFKQSIYLNDMLIFLIGGIILGIVTCGGALYVDFPPFLYTGSCPPGAEVVCNSWVRFQIAPATFLITMILGAVVVPAGVRTFGREKEVFSREANVGANKLAYFLGKLCSDLPFLVLNTFIFTTPLAAIAPWRGPVNTLYGILVCVACTVQALSYFLSFILKDPDAAVLTGVITAILVNLFSGFVPRLGDGIIGQITYGHWSARAICTNELYYGQRIDTVEDYNQTVPEPWRDPNIAFDCLMLLLIAVILCFASFGMLAFNNRKVA